MHGIIRQDPSPSLMYWAKISPTPPAFTTDNAAENMVCLRDCEKQSMIFPAANVAFRLPRSHPWLEEVNVSVSHTM